LLNLYIDLQEVREYLNYLNTPSGHEKFALLRRGHLIDSIFFGEQSFSNNSEMAIEPLQMTLERYYDFLHRIELCLVSKSKTNGNRPDMFRAIRRFTLYDWYGEDFMPGYFSSDVLRETNAFLKRYDESYYILPTTLNNA
jgi:hypothetical protein